MSVRKGFLVSSNAVFVVIYCLFWKKHRLSESDLGSQSDYTTYISCGP